MHVLCVFMVYVCNCHVCDWSHTRYSMHVEVEDNLGCCWLPSPLLETDSLSFTAVEARVACELLGIFPISASVIVQDLGSERDAHCCSWPAFTQVPGPQLRLSGLSHRHVTYSPVASVTATFFEIITLQPLTQKVLSRRQPSLKTWSSTNESRTNISYWR